MPKKEDEGGRVDPAEGEGGEMEGRGRIDHWNGREGVDEGNTGSKRGWSSRE